MHAEGSVRLVPEVKILGKLAERSVRQYMIHHGLYSDADMWLGTMSSRIPSPCDRAPSTKPVHADSPPKSSLIRVGSVTSYPCWLPGTACRQETDTHG